MDTSASDVSLADFNDSYKVPRKRKKKIAPPLKFKEEPLDLHFNSPDRPRAATNPRGAPCVHPYNNTYNWISPDKFEAKLPRVTCNNRTVRQTKTAVRQQQKACDHRDCQNIHHKHHLSLSSNDSDLLLLDPTNRSSPSPSRDDPTNRSSPSPPRDENSPITVLPQHHMNNPMIEPLNNHIKLQNTSTPVRSTRTPVRSTRSSSALSIVTKRNQVTPSTSPVSANLVSPSPVSPAPVSPAPVSPAPVSPAPVSPTMVSPSPVSPSPSHDRTPKQFQQFRTVGYSQCKSVHKIKKPRHPRKNENIPINQDRVPESPLLPASKYRRLSSVNTPKEKGVLLAENTPEHLAGLRMVSRRLRDVLGNPVCDSQR